jgi:hypothetical protein
MIQPQRAGRGKAATKGKTGIHRRGTEYAEIFLFQTLSLSVLSASAVNHPNSS